MKASVLDRIRGLPGESHVRQGLADLQSGRHAALACIVSIARTRLGNAGLLNCSVPATPEPERRIYRLLQIEDGDAYSRFNAWLREFISFEQALDHRLRREAR